MSILRLIGSVALLVAPDGLRGDNRDLKSLDFESRTLEFESDTSRVALGVKKAIATVRATTLPRNFLKAPRLNSRRGPQPYT